MILRLRGDLNLDLELTDRVQIPQVAELIMIDGQYYRVREIRRGYVTDDERPPENGSTSSALRTVTGWDVAAYVTKTGIAEKS